MLRRSLPLLAVGLLLAVPPLGAQEKIAITVKGDKHDLKDVPICVPLSLARQDASFPEAHVTLPSGQTIAGQLTAPGLMTERIAPSAKELVRRDLHFVLPAIKGDASLAVVAKLHKLVPPDSTGFFWLRQGDQTVLYLDVLSGAKRRPVMSYMHAPYDKAKHETHVQGVPSPLRPSRQAAGHQRRAHRSVHGREEAALSTPSWVDVRVQPDQLRWRQTGGHVARQARRYARGAREDADSGSGSRARPAAHAHPLARAEERCLRDGGARADGLQRQRRHTGGVCVAPGDDRRQGAARRRSAARRLPVPRVQRGRREERQADVLPAARRQGERRARRATGSPRRRRAPSTSPGTR